MDIQYLQAFVDEGEEHLENLNDGIMNLEAGQSPELVNEIFRSAHTLKGMAASMGFNRLADLTHGMEDLLQGIRNGSLSVDNGVIDMLFKCLDAIERMMDNIKRTAQEGEVDVGPLIQALNKYTGGSGQGESGRAEVVSAQIRGSAEEYEKGVVESALKQGYNVFRVNITIDRESQLKAARAFVVFNTLQNMGDIINSEPGVEEIEKGNIGEKLLLDIITKADESYLKQAILDISEIQGVEVAPLKFDNDNSAGKENTPSLKKNGESVVKLTKSIRVDVNKLDELMNLVGEFLITKSRVKSYLGNVSEEITAALDYLDRITSDMHDAVMSLRMEPIERVFKRFPRMVRDLSRTLNKKIDFVMEGENTEVDMTIIDELADPLVHLIRNSIDHGIEGPEERLRLGKPETGTVSLKAYHDGNKIVIQVSDDGKGIDMDRVIKKAVSRGLVDPSEAHSLTRSQILDFLFMSGFSTSEQVTEISGRGVGLDVVKNKVEELGGNIDVITEKGKGTTFLLSFPLTLSMIEALLVKVCDETFAVPLSTIIEIVDIKREQVKKVRNRDTFVYNGNIIPLVRLKDLLKIDGSSDDEAMQVFVVRKGDRLVGVVVDQVLGQEEIVIKSPGKYLSDYKFISGVTILNNGDISLIIDIILLL